MNKKINKEQVKILFMLGKLLNYINAWHKILKKNNFLNWMERIMKEFWDKKYFAAFKWIRKSDMSKS